MKRLIVIFWTLLRYDVLAFVPARSRFSLLVFCLRRLRSFAARRRSIGQNMVLAMVKLGPAFVKLGQILSTRSDIVGLDIAKELSELQDNVPSFPYQHVARQIEEDFGVSVDVLFADFNMAPVAAASVAQVHKATLRTGEVVAVKVLRPNIRQKFKRDLKALKQLLRIAERFLHRAERFRFDDTLALIEKTLMNELDMRLEAAGCEELRENFSSDPHYCPPKPYWSLTTRRIFTMEWIDGVSIDDVARIKRLGLKPEDILKRSSSTIFYQIFRDGFFHADLHGGNAFITKDGAIRPVDFGIMGRIDEASRMYLAELLLGLIQGDYQKVANIHAEAGYIGNQADIGAFAQACRAIASSIVQEGAVKISYADLLGEFMKIMEEFDMVVQPQLLMLQKAMLMAEGMGQLLDEGHNIWDLSKPNIESFMRDHYRPDRVISRQMRIAKEQLKSAPKVIDMFKDTMAKYDVMLRQFPRHSQRSYKGLCGFVAGVLLSFLIYHIGGLW